MNRLSRTVGSSWLPALLGVGGLLGVTLLVQTFVNYRYVADSLIQQSARRTSEERIRDVERATRLTRPQDSAGFQLVLDEIRSDAPEQIAEIRLLQADNVVVAASPGTRTTADPPAVIRRTGTLSRETRDGRAVFVGLFNCRCSLPRNTGGAGGESRDSTRLQVELTLFEDSLSAPFARLRRNTAISASAALALIVALVLIGVRARGYIEGRRLQSEVELARTVQWALFPDPGQWPATDVSATCVPASQVGGDFYDVAVLPDGRVSFVVGDVSGHGLSAALLMALVHGAMSNPPWGVSEPPAQSAARLNDLLLVKSSAARFASLFWCAYDSRNRVLTYLNAGHPSALLLRSATNGQSVERLSGGGPVLGLIPGAAFETQTIEAGEGDVLVIVSDGLTEASDRSGNYFGDAKLLEVVEQVRTLPAAELRDAIMAAVTGFTGDRPAPDDRTLLVARLWSGATPASVSDGRLQTYKRLTSPDV